jgi:hypothetical protein
MKNLLSRACIAYCGSPMSPTLSLRRSMMRDRTAISWLFFRETVAPFQSRASGRVPFRADGRQQEKEIEQ